MMIVIAALWGWLLARPPSAADKRAAIDWCRSKYDSARTLADTLRVDRFHLRGNRLTRARTYTECADYRLTGMR